MCCASLEANVPDPGADADGARNALALAVLGCVSIHMTRTKAPLVPLLKL